MTASDRFLIYHIDGIVNTPAMRLAVRGWHDMFEAGFADGGLVISWDDQVVLALDREDDDKPVGLITWMKIAWAKQAFVKLGYVLPEYRRQGLYTAMFDDLKSHVRRLGGIREITGAIHPQNEAIHVVSDAQNRRIVAHLTSIKI